MAKLSNQLNALLCYTGFHQWTYDKKGLTFKGMAQPLKCQKCFRCNLSQREIITKEYEVKWIEDPDMSVRLKF